jgi:uncharacterized repeat protein (TIGR03803 family)
MHLYPHRAGDLLFSSAAITWGKYLKAGDFHKIAAITALAAAFATAGVAGANAQSFSTLYSFTNGLDGANLYCGLALSGNTLYGATWQGGHLGNGTIFSVNTNGYALTLLDTLNGNDGSGAYAGMVLSGNTLFGTTSGGGADGYGAVFKVNISGAPMTVLHGFTNGNDGGLPYGGVVLSGDTLYGTTWQGPGTSGGVVYAISTNGGPLRVVHNFAAFADGQSVQGGLVLAGGMLYGTAVFGGAFGNGTVFVVNTNGSGFKNLYSFPLLSNATNSVGAFPYAGLAESGGVLFGTAAGGGLFANGTIFSIGTNGTGFTVLHTFSSTASISSPNSDGATPKAALILSGSVLYGTAVDGGSAGNGVVFEINTDGSGFAVLHHFSAFGAAAGTNFDGATPSGSLVMGGNQLFGTTFEGGRAGYGTVFSVAPAPALSAYVSAPNIVLTWPTNGAYALESSPGVGADASWTTVGNAPVIVGGQNVVSNPLTQPQLFFRLRQ